MVIVANKCDLHDHTVDLKIANSQAKRLGVPFVQTSAKTRMGVNDAYYTLVREIRKDRMENGKVKSDKDKSLLNLLNCFKTKDLE